MSRNPSDHLMKLLIDNNAAVLVITWKPLPLKCRRKMFHPTNCFHLVWTRKSVRLENRFSMTRMVQFHLSRTYLCKLHQQYLSKCQNAHTQTFVFCWKVLMFFSPIKSLTNSERITGQKLEDSFKSVKFDYVQYHQLTTNQLIRICSKIAFQVCPTIYP